MRSAPCQVTPAQGVRVASDCVAARMPARSSSGGVGGRLEGGCGYSVGTRFIRPACVKALDSRHGLRRARFVAMPPQTA